MNILSTTFILVSLFLICSCDQQTQKDNKTLADRIFTNGKIYTLDTDQPWAEAVAIKNDNIVYVGDNKGMRSWIGSETIQQDLKGQMLLPGFIDSHAHPVAGGAYVNTLSLDTYSNPQGWLDEINDYSATNPDLEILFGYGFLASAFGLKGPTSQ
ncbi:MAG: amidohydrolase family protein, partial [Kangiellaceae bacterium]|nr:amidohydrolase family protein [Kangiellaceae bacterium]